jgi:hypothetical protein
MDRTARTLAADGKRGGGVMGKRNGLLGMLLGVVLMSAGCCRFCDRMCGQHTAAVAPVGGQCCYVPCCPTGTVAASPAVPTVPAVGGWNQPAGGVCVPCR